MGKWLARVVVQFLWDAIDERLAKRVHVSTINWRKPTGF